MKLYKVKVWTDLVVRAPDERTAKRAAVIASVEGMEEPSTSDVERVDCLDDLPKGWDKHCRPWGERDGMDRTIGEMMQSKPDAGT